mgnify:CR=1 FL=1
MKSFSLIFIFVFLFPVFLQIFGEEFSQIDELHIYSDHKNSFNESRLKTAPPGAVFICGETDYVQMKEGQSLIVAFCQCPYYQEEAAFWTSVAIRLRYGDDAISLFANSWPYDDFCGVSSSCTCPGLCPSCQYGYDSLTHVSTFTTPHCEERTVPLAIISCTESRGIGNRCDIEYSVEYWKLNATERDHTCGN